MASNNQWPEKAKISRPSDLTAWIQELKNAIRTGVLRQYMPKNMPIGASKESLLDVSDKGPWPDELQFYFVTQENLRYILYADTYHGWGEWKLLADDVAIL